MHTISKVIQTKATGTLPRKEYLAGIIVIPAALITGATAALLAQFAGRTCGTKSLLGIPCPTCGTTRALNALVHGDLIGAFTLQPLVVIVCALALLYSLYAAAVVFLGLPRLFTFPKSWMSRGIFFSIVVMLIAVNWVFLLINGR